MYHRRLARWRRLSACAVCRATEGLENEQSLILQPLPSHHLRNSSFSNASVASPRSQLLLSLHLCHLASPPSHIVYTTPMQDVGRLRDRIVEGCETIRKSSGIPQRVRDSMPRRRSLMLMKDIENYFMRYLYSIIYCGKVSVTSYFRLQV